MASLNRKRVGHRNHLADIQAPPTSVDEYGQISYSDGTWTSVVSGWWCELVDVGGGEILDGVQTKETTTKVATGDSSAVKGLVTPKCRVVIGGKIYGVTAVRDISGDNMVTRIELKAAE